MANLKQITRYLLIGLLVVGATACNPEEDTIAIITVVDSDDDPVSGVEVKLFASPNFPLGDPTRLDMEGWTDAMGQVVFDYTELYSQGQSGFAVLDVSAVKDTLVGLDLIKILEEEVNEKKVIIE